MPEKKLNLSDDQKREIVLDCLYGVYRSSRGRKSVRKTSQEVYKDVKNQGLNTKDVGASLHYLNEEGWVSIDEETKNVTTKSGQVVPSTKFFYFINKNGIDRKENDSAFRLEQNYHGINVSNIQDSVVVIGEHNKAIVIKKYADAANLLQDLRGRILDSNELSDLQKMDAASDIDSLLSQFQKANADKTIIQKLWDGIREAAYLANLFELTEKINSLLTTYL